MEEENIYKRFLRSNGFRFIIVIIMLIILYLFIINLNEIKEYTKLPREPCNMCMALNPNVECINIINNAIINNSNLKIENLKDI